ncbi:unnamed protein product [Arabis nemorensis]|uniref:Uncharacterized protein n=1 Tax=Arabis nemorensis TaxID=586526 RepID=A0A565AR71_9BRAS|nr:unnamed protein product [Arabis nemorensis]
MARKKSLAKRTESDEVDSNEESDEESVEESNEASEEEAEEEVEAEVQAEVQEELSEGLKDIHEKLDAQDKRIIAVEAFVKNAQDSVPDMDDEWRCNDVGYDFSFDRAGIDQEGADTAGKGAGSVGKEAGEEEAWSVEAGNRYVVMEGEVGVSEPEGDVMEESESEMDPNVIAAESHIESEGKTDEVGYEEIVRTPSKLVKRGNQKLKILSSQKKRIRRPSRFQLSPFDH